MVTTEPAAAGPSLEPSEADALDSAIETAWRFVAPLWPLRRFVAVNPWMGLSDEPFPVAARTVDRIFHAPMTMAPDWYRARAAEGRVLESELERAREELAGLLSHASDVPVPRVRTYSSALDAQTGSRWNLLVVEEMAKWCAARFDAGQAAWPQPWQDLGPWAAWREAASLDPGPELRGLEGLRSYASELPADPRRALRRVLAQLEIPSDAWADVLARSLIEIRGWAGHVRWRTREAAMGGGDDGDLEVEFLAARMAYEGALRAHLGPSGRSWAELMEGRAEPGESDAALGARLAWHTAFEGTWRRGLVERLHRGSAVPRADRPVLQAVFCIDVRSEILRRHLEALSPRIQTVGFAGFFGFPVAYRRLGEAGDTPRCPVLLSPAHRIREGWGPAPEGARPLEPQEIRARERANHANFLAARLSSVSSFSVAETVGTLFGLRILTDSVQATHPRADGAFFPSRLEGQVHPELEPGPDGAGLTLETQVDLAESALRGMGLVDAFADVVLLCGHGSQTANNPYGSGLDCGACGGHAGDVNARVAAAVLERPEVREGLRSRGITIPDETRFVAGLHVTTTDEVELFGAERLAPELRRKIQGWLGDAGRAARSERLPTLTRGRSDGVDAAQEVRRRALDWSEVRPEWGLAQNAAFIAARRDRTRGLDLEGRVFLHDYDADKDPTGGILELILTAPLVVASWINLQYFASTVAPEVFGSGNKLLHNVVGRHGVMQGNVSDLMVGLPFQSVHDGARFLHEPIRLQAIIEATTDDIDAVLARHPDVRALVDHGWIHLMAWPRDQGPIVRRYPNATWRPA